MTLTTAHIVNLFGYICMSMQYLLSAQITKFTSLIQYMMVEYLARASVIQKAMSEPDTEDPFPRAIPQHLPFESTQ